MPRLKSESLEDGEVVLASLLVWFLASILPGSLAKVLPSTLLRSLARFPVRVLASISAGSLACFSVGFSMCELPPLVTAWFLAPPSVDTVGISWIGSRSWDVFQALTGVLRSCSWRVFRFTEFLRGQHMLTRIGLLPVQMFLSIGISYFFLVCLMTFQHNNFAYFLKINF